MIRQRSADRLSRGPPTARRAAAVRAALAAILMTGCVGSPTGPTPSAPTVWNPMEYDPPAEYAGWAGTLALCMERPLRDPEATVRSVTWVAVDAIDPGQERWDADARAVIVTMAQYAIVAGHPTIYLLRQAIHERRSVKHELTHHLLWDGPERDADARHRGPYWACKDA